jgi:hypothetical protein
MKRIDWLSIMALCLVTLYFVDWFIEELVK